MMLPIIYGIAFIFGSAVAWKVYKIRQKRQEKEITEWINGNILMLALQDVPPVVYTSLCTSFGRERANEILIENWIVKHIL